MSEASAGPRGPGEFRRCRQHGYTENRKRQPYFIGLLCALVLPGGNRSPVGVAGALRGGFFWGAAGGQCRREGPGKSERQRSAVERHGFGKDQSGVLRHRKPADNSFQKALALKEANSLL